MTILEDTSVVLGLSDFGDYSDVDGDAMASVKITTLEDNGSLEYFNGSSWVAVVQDQIISAADIIAGHLRFVPDSNETGSPYTTIGYQVSDGTDFSASAYTLTVSVTPIPDQSQIILGPAVTVYEKNLERGTDPQEAELVKSGTFTLLVPDGLQSLSINGANVIDDLGNVIPDVLISMSGGTLRVTSYDKSTGDVGYEYTFNGNIPHSNPGSDTEADTALLVLLDGSSNSTTANLVVNVVDDVPLVVANSAQALPSVPGETTILSGSWIPTIGADALPTIEEFLADVRLLSVQVTSGTVVQQLPSNAFTLTRVVDSPESTDPALNQVTYQGTVTYDPDGPMSSRTVPISITLSKNAQNEYIYDVVIGGIADVVIVPVDFQGALLAGGPTNTYLISYVDAETGATINASVNSLASTKTDSFTLQGSQAAETYANVTYVGTSINASSDGIGVDNNVISSTAKAGVLTTEGIAFAPSGTASSVTLNFKLEGAVGFGNGGAQDVLYVTVHGKKNGADVSYRLLLDSRSGDFFYDVATSKWLPISPGNNYGVLTSGTSTDYVGGPLAAYKVGLMAGWDSISNVDVTAGFYTTRNGGNQVVNGSDVKIAFGF